MILIEGEAGVGKTRLVEEFAGYVQRQGAWVLPGRCYAFERNLSYQPLVEALRCLINLLGQQDRRNFPSWVLAEVKRLIPEIAIGDSGSGEALPADLVGEQERLFEGLARFISQISTQRPLLMVLEDLHWAAESTLGLLHYLARMLAGQSILLVGTFRPESGDALPALRELRVIQRDQALFLPPRLLSSGYRLSP
jgi:predicted ATPase